MLADGGRVGSEVAAALLFGFGRGVAYESRERNFRVDDDVFLLGQVQHDVGSQVVSLGVLDVVLRFVVDALDERRTVQDRFQQHFAPVALHFRIAFQCVRQVRGLGRDAPVEFHQVFQLGLQFAALCRLGGVDVLDALSEFGDVVAEGFEQHVERLLVGLLEMLGLLAQYLGCKVAELGPEGLLQFFALGFFGRAILGVLRAQRCDLGLGRGAECRQFRFGACPLLGQRLHLSFVALPQLFFRGQGLFRGGQPGFGHRQPRRGIALAGFGGLVISGKPSGVPAPQYEEQCDGHCQAACSGQYEKGGRSHRVFLCLFPCKNSNLFPEKHPVPGHAR